MGLGALSGPGADRPSDILDVSNGLSDSQAVDQINNIALMGTASAAQAMAVVTAGAVFDTVERHGSALMTYDHRDDAADLWADVHGTTSRAGSFRAGTTDYGYKGELAGITVRADWGWGGEVAVGVALSAGGGSARGHGHGRGVKNDVDYWGASLYGVWMTPHVNFMGSVGYLVSGNEIKHQGYKAEPDVRTISVGARAEVPIRIRESVDVTPHVGARFLRVDMDGFTAGGFRYGADSAYLFQLPVGLAVSGVFEAAGGVLKPYVDLKISPTIGDSQVDNRVALAGTSVSDTLEARIAANAICSVGFGLDATLKSHSLGADVYLGAGQDNSVE